MRKRFALALPFVMGLAACAGTSSTDSVLLAPSPGSGSATSSSTSPIEGRWQLVSLQKAGQAVVVAPAGGRFNADFQSNGHVSLQADCNMCSAGYVVAGSALRVGGPNGLMACTRAYCSTAPLDTDYAALVTSAQTWRVDGSELTLQSGDGTLRLRR
jgi:heat shock protein HslJ